MPVLRPGSPPTEIDKPSHQVLSRRTAHFGTSQRPWFSTTDLILPLEERRITLSSRQVYRLVEERSERLSLKILMSLLDILDCTMEDLIEPIAATGAARKSKKAAAGGSRHRGDRGLRPKRARIAPVDR